MARTLDYYHFLISPWSYLAIGRFNELREKFAIPVNYKPIDVTLTFSKMGGVPLAERHPSRQRLRLAELKRWSDYLEVPINLNPAHFPVDQTLAACMVYAAGGANASLEAGLLSDAILTACWAEQQDVSDESTLIELAKKCGLDGKALAQKRLTDTCVATFSACTAEAHKRDVFGSPTYVLDGENYWGQDRLDFLARAMT